jgi:hypothetical protein
MWQIILLISFLLFVLAWLAQKRAEAFIDMPNDIPNPTDILNKVKGYISMIDDQAAGDSSLPDVMQKVKKWLSAVDKPELWTHATNVMDKDPGELARMELQKRGEDNSRLK